MEEKIVYIHGCIHGPGKASPADVVVQCDEMTQSELDALEMNRVPITLDHPPDGVYVKDTPELVCGEIMQTTRANDGSKYILGWLSTKTQAGQEAYNRLKAGELGLSLGHKYDEVRYADTKELHSRSFAPDHVSLCKNPRRPGCWIKVAAAARPLTTEAYLAQQSYTDTNAMAAAQAAPPPDVSAATARTAPLSKMAEAQTPAQPSSAPAQPVAGAPMDTSAPASSDPIHNTLMQAAEEVKFHREREAKFNREYAEMQAKLEALTRERETLVKEREDAKQRAMEAEKMKAEKASKTIANVLKNLKSLKGLGVIGDEGELTHEALMKTQFPNGVNSAEDVGRVRQLERFEMIACAAAERDEAVKKYEELRDRVFSKDAPADSAPKRLRPDSAAASPFMQPTIPATPAATQTTTFQSFQSTYNARKPLTPDRLFGPVAVDFESMVAKAPARNHNSFWQEPQEYTTGAPARSSTAPWNR